jgi:hypothetical protein
MSAGWRRNPYMSARAPVDPEWVVVCAWCEADLPEAEKTRGEKVSHGCCSKHVDEIRAQVAARRSTA